MYHVLALHLHLIADRELVNCCTLICFEAPGAQSGRGTKVLAVPLGHT